ncbi:MAG: S-methyl-5'-thioadenosine phosphorylase [Dehalococcoidia bacterium]
MADAERADVGVIGGSGFYDMPGLGETRIVQVTTPYGDPSSAIVLGSLKGRRIAFIARHGEGHRILPEEVPSQANIYALKALGVRHVISVSAVGSLREDIEPLHAVAPDQAIDRTHGRPGTFFGDGAVAHVGLADPFCPALAPLLAGAAGAAGVKTHRGGTLVVVNGPAFSTRAESNLYRQWGGDIIGMTALPEARLAREAELHYAALCFVTDYDVWRQGEADVSAGLVMENLDRNVEKAREAVAIAIGTLNFVGTDCGCEDALAGALVTPRDRVPAATRARLGAIVERYWGAP